MRRRRMKMQQRIAVAAVVAAGLLGFGLPAASAHTGSLITSARCQDDGTRLVTYTGTTVNVPAEGHSGHTAQLTVGEIEPTGTRVTPPTQSVVGNTTFTFTQTIPGDAGTVSATAFLVWGDGAKSDPIGSASFTKNCTPPKPTPSVQVTQSDDKNCDSKTVTTTTVTTTTDWALNQNNIWVQGNPVSTVSAQTRPTTPQECPVVEPPVVEPPVVEPPVVEPPVVEPPVVEPPVDESPVEVLGVQAVAPVLVPAAVNPLPTAAAAGEADSSGQVVAGGSAGLAAFLMLGAGFVLRRRRGEV